MEKHIPSDYEILSAIYDRYYTDFKSLVRSEPDRLHRIRIPIDVNEIAEMVGVEEEMIFGRIYYHFNKKYSYEDENGKQINFFSSGRVEGLRLNFPLVASLLADLKMEQARTDRTPVYASLAAATLAVMAFVIAVFF